MSRLLVIEILSGSVVGVSFDTGEQLDVSVAVVDHNDKRVYRNGEAEQGGEEILSLAKGDGYTDEDDEADNEPYRPPCDCDQSGGGYSLCSHCFAEQVGGE